MTRNDLRLSAAAFLIAAYAVPLTGCNKTSSPSPPDEPVVSGNAIRFPASSLAVQRLITAPVTATHENVFSLPARIAWDEDHTSRITSPIAGRLDEIEVEAGSPVKANQPLAYLTSPELGSAQTEAARAQADLEQAERTLARDRDLYAVSGVAAKDVEQAQADLERTRAEAERTRLRLRSLGADNTVDQHFAIRSPIDGVVVERNTNPGMEWLPDQPVAPLFVVSDPTYLWCWIDAPEHAVSMLHPGMKVVLHASAWPEETFNARIDFVSDALDPASRTVKVRARLRNPERHLKGEMYVTARLTGQPYGVLDVPADAVFLDNERQQVFVRTGEGQYLRKTIVPVASNERWVSIDGGLNKGDEVVVDGALYLEKILEDNEQSGTGIAPQDTSANKPPAQ
jgi:cobalt-zinc-cadmium efflux system membrane fusion protein